jgi:hypothetical protein
VDRRAYPTVIPKDDFATAIATSSHKGPRHGFFRHAAAGARAADAA